MIPSLREWRRALLGTEEHPDVATSYDALGSVLVAEERTADAVVAYRRALTIRDKCLPAGSPERSTTSEQSSSAKAGGASSSSNFACASATCPPRR
jgi:hypothetical protein